MAGLKADMPDFIDSGGAQDIGRDMVMNQVLPLVFGTAAAGIAILIGAGLLSSLRPVLSNVPVVGSLIQQGGNAEDSPAGWVGL